METDPISKEGFFGRREILDLLEKRFKAFLNGYRHNIGLIGLPHIGKSSILAYFLHSVVAQEAIPIFIRLQEGDSFSVFSQKWLGGILHGYQNFLQLQPAITFGGLVRQMRRRLPRLLKKMRRVKKLVQNRRYNESYQELLNLSQMIHEESGHRILFVIDEFDRLVNLPLDNPFGKLGKEIMLQKNTMFVVSSSKPEAAQEIFKDKLALLFSNFETIKVHQLNFEEADQWVSERFVKTFSDPFLRKIFLYLTNGHPYYLDLLMRKLEILRRSEQMEEITLHLFILAITQELFDHQGALYQHFLRNVCSVSRSRSSLAAGDVLLALALGRKKVSAIVKYLDAKVVDVKKVLQRLLEDGFVEKRGSFFDIADLLFRFWLAEVYFRKRAALDSDYETSRSEFIIALESFLKAVTLEERKDLTLRIEELFKRFHNEVVRLETTKVRCPRFTEVHARPTNGRAFPVLATSQNSNWLCQVVRDRLEEDDVRLFLDDLNKSKNQIQKRLMIALQGMDLNAKLLARVAKVELWNLRDLNILMDLYGRPKVIQ